MDQETASHFAGASGSGSGRDANGFRAPYHALIQESLLLSDSEVTISFMKFLVGVAILNFPAQSAYHGILNACVGTVIIVYLVAKSIENLVKAIPVEVMNRNYTYGQLVGHTFGHKSYKDAVDLLVILCQGSNYMLYLKYVGDQLNQILCQETDDRFCATDRYFLLYYYIPVSIAVLILSQTKNYKQLSYLAKLAMIGTVIALVALILDSIL